MNGYKIDKVAAFLKEIAQVCAKHGMSIGHEDTHGGFRVEEYNPENIKWLGWATCGELFREWTPAGYVDPPPPTFPEGRTTVRFDFVNGSLREVEE